ncbi:esterase/lipase family protein [Planctomicrobium sp. SH664]|uniref:esterase/lipase family protein n=1 Tax=Planctomicrobium sp. SH664 TaxID=3448125 RepID=UPI003F5BE311
MTRILVRGFPGSFHSLLLSFLVLGMSGDQAGGADPMPPAGDGNFWNSPVPAANAFWKPNIPFPTLGGRQVWGDVAYFRGYRIQHNVLTGHYRLLDGDDVRRAWGDLEHCRAKLKQLREEQRLEPMSGKVVIVIHGITRSSKSFSTLTDKLAEAGYTVVPFDYPSTRVSIEESAAYLQQLIESLEGVEEINLVVHSMGGLVVRTYLHLCAETGPDPRMRRMVMIGVPNQGARMASLLANTSIFKKVMGEAGQQLADGDGNFVQQLPTPGFEFAIISGATGTERGLNPLVAGDDDGTISVECTRLPGARDFMTVPVLHSFLMSDPTAQESTLRFLQTGSLHADGVCQPIPDADPEEASAEGLPSS